MARQFGSFLSTARGLRGLTLDTLAASAMVSSATIAKASNKDVCPWKPSVRHAVLRALHRRVPLSDAELELAVKTGLIESEELAREILRAGDPRAIPAEPSRIRHAFRTFLATCGPEESEFFKTAGNLVASLGTKEATRVLSAVSAALATQDSPPIGELPSEEQARRLVYVDDVTFENWRVRVFTPHPSAPPQGSKARKHA